MENIKVKLYNEFNERDSEYSEQKTLQLFFQLGLLLNKIVKGIIVVPWNSCEKCRNIISILTTLNLSFDVAYNYGIVAVLKETPLNHTFLKEGNKEYIHDLLGFVNETPYYDIFYRYIESGNYNKKGRLNDEDYSQFINVLSVNDEDKARAVVEKLNKYFNYKFEYKINNQMKPQEIYDCPSMEHLLQMLENQQLFPLEECNLMTEYGLKLHSSELDPNCLIALILFIYFPPKDSIELDDLKLFIQGLKQITNGTIFYDSTVKYSNNEIINSIFTIYSRNLKDYGEAINDLYSHINDIIYLFFTDKDVNPVKQITQAPEKMKQLQFDKNFTKEDYLRSIKIKLKFNPYIKGLLSKIEKFKELDDIDSVYSTSLQIATYYIDEITKLCKDHGNIEICKKNVNAIEQQCKQVKEDYKEYQYQIEFLDINIENYWDFKKFFLEYSNFEFSVAIIVPFRNTPGQKRGAQLKKFEQRMIEFLGQNKKISYFHIYIIEQSDDNRKFNRGKLLNIGYKIAEEEHNYDSYIFHDVDLLPHGKISKYYSMKPSSPIHIASGWKRYGSNPKYFGGIVAFSKYLYELIDGYPNIYWGWGGEDDELYKRVKHAGLDIQKADEMGKYITDLENMNAKQKRAILKKNKNWDCELKWETNDLHRNTRESKKPPWWGLSSLYNTPFGNSSYDILEREDFNYISKITVDIKDNYEETGEIQVTKAKVYKKKY